MGSERKPRKATALEQLIFTAAQLCARQHDTIVFGGRYGTGLAVANALCRKFRLGVTFKAPEPKRRRARKETPNAD